MSQLAELQDEIIHIDTSSYLGLTAPAQKLRTQLDITVAARSCPPQVDDLSKDWISSVAVPAFKLIHARQGVQRAVCALGTGVGLDALAAVETLEATRLGITDVHDEVVSTAASNILSNILPGHDVKLESGFGDLLAPLSHSATRYDLIYENLPNVQIDDASRITAGRTSTSHLPPRLEPIPNFVQQQFLSLHYLALQQAHDYLSPGGAVLSMLGSRIPLAVYREMAHHAGHRAEIYTFSWKIQAEAEDVIFGHAEQQRAGFGPFHFYRVEDLREAFAGVSLADSGAIAFDIEDRLAARALDPFQAWATFLRGEQVGHTCVALRSQPL
jgi:methylase of polypeptide subunit release factors